MSTELLESIVRTLVNHVAKGEYDAVVEKCSNSRLTADDIRKVIREYGRAFVEPPPEAYRDLDAVALRDIAQPAWSVRVPLWSIEEGQSDLTLEVTLTRAGDCWEVELDDLHVL